MGKKARRILQNEQGLSMILVLCIGAVFVALSAALVYAASVLTANANRQLREQEIYNLAKSFSDVLDEQLTSYTGDSADENGGLGAFINDTYLRPIMYSNATEHVFTDEANGLEIKLKKTPADEINNAEYVVTLTTQEKTARDLLTMLDDYKDKVLPDYMVDVTVTATQDGETFSYTRSYQHSRSYEENDIYYTITSAGEAHFNGYRLESSADEGDKLIFTKNGSSTVHTLNWSADTEIKIHYNMSAVAQTCKFVRQ
ncbi:hypothetical protein [Gemmiger sp.]